METNNKYAIGDFVMFDTDNNESKIGKIEDIFEDQGDKLVRYLEFILAKNKKELLNINYFSVKELLQTNNIEKEFFDNIKQKLKVLNYENYLIYNNKNNELNNENIYFYRQNIDLDTNILSPEIDSCPKCNIVINPDNEYIICSKCNLSFHDNCYIINNNNKECPNCNKIIILSKNELLNKKRTNVRNNNNNNKNLENLETPLNKDLSINNNNYLNSSTNKIQPQHQVNEENFNNLPEDNRKYLNNLQNIIQNVSLLEQKSMTQDQKLKRLAKDKLVIRLLYGIEEIKSFNYFSKLLDITIDINDFSNKDGYKSGSIKLVCKDDDNNYYISEESARKYCDKLSNQIESIVYYNNKRVISLEYKDKQKTLLYNLNIPENTELRLKILSGEITPLKLTEMSSDELAPTKLKKSRTERHNRYLNEQVYKNKEDMKIISKSHKGETILTLDGEVTNEIIEDNIDKLNEIANENNFNKVIYEEDEENNSNSSSKESDNYNASLHNLNKKNYYEKNNNTVNIKINNSTKANVINTINSKTIFVNSANNNNQLNISKNNISNYDIEYTIEGINKFIEDAISILSDKTRDEINNKRKQWNLI